MTQQHEKIYREHEPICLQGSEADCLYVLRRGAVAIYVNTDKDKPEIAEVLGKGIRVGVFNTRDAVIGEGGLFLQRRSASLIAQADDTALQHIPVGGNGLQKAMLERASLGLTVCRSLAARLRDLAEVARDVSHLAEAVSRAKCNLAVDLAHLLEQIPPLFPHHPELKHLFEEMEKFPQAQEGKELLHQRRDTSVIIMQALAMRQRSGVLNLKPGDLLCEEGKFGRTVYFVKKGILDVTVGSSIIGRIGHDEIVGEVAVLLKEAPKRIATVRASVPCVLQCIPITEFLELAESKPALMVPIAKRMAMRLEATNRLVSLRSHASRTELDSLAKAPGSCEELFLRLAAQLESYDDAESITSKARAHALEASRLRNEIAQGCLG
jgi:CRP-like cAMP-binding protein